MTTPVPFDEDFLGPTTPMPSRPGLIELPYMHFTVSMDPNRRLAAVTAAARHLRWRGETSAGHGKRRGSADGPHREKTMTLRPWLLLLLLLPINQRSIVLLSH